MNIAILKGRLTDDPKVTYSKEMAIARFNMAINKDSKDGGADFPSCVAFGKTAETMEKYLSKGSQIVVIGRIQTGSYDKQDGTKVYTTDVVVSRFEFCEKAVAKEEQPAELPEADINGFMQIPDGFQEELSFN